MWLKLEDLPSGKVLWRNQFLVASCQLWPEGPPWSNKQNPHPRETIDTMKPYSFQAKFLSPAEGIFQEVFGVNYIPVCSRQIMIPGCPTPRPHNYKGACMTCWKLASLLTTQSAMKFGEAACLEKPSPWPHGENSTSPIHLVYCLVHHNFFLLSNWRPSSNIYFRCEIHPIEFAHLLDGHKFIFCICPLVDLIFIPARQSEVIRRFTEGKVWSSASRPKSALPVFAFPLLAWDIMDTPFFWTIKSLNYF